MAPGVGSGGALHDSVTAVTATASAATAPVAGTSAAAPGRRTATTSVTSISTPVVTNPAVVVFSSGDSTRAGTMKGIVAIRSPSSIVSSHRPAPGAESAPAR
ncbi:hypothetical protein ACTMTF_20805 [Nonomuraea sp. ZG12]|uniref:hypothetical protein n=1 Tax=Nonomuraea sp. ZG12 TaxID=3452207 RepID=UPI003F88B46F